MERIYNEVRTPYKQGMVVAPSDVSYMIDCPTVFRYGKKWYMTYVCYNGRSGRDGRGYETWLAESDDLLSWQSLGQLLSYSARGWDKNQHGGFPSLIDWNWNGSYKIKKYENRYWMTYLGGEGTGYEGVSAPLYIGISSTDKPLSLAHEWDKEDKPLLHCEDVGAQWWEKLIQYKSTIYEDKTKTLGSRFVMYYNAGGINPDNQLKAERIGIALSDDLKHWERFPGNPVFYQESAGIITGDAQIAKMGKLYVMFYFQAFNPDKPYKAYNTFAVSRNLTDWQRWDGEDLIFPTEPYDEMFAHKSYVMKYKGTVYHFYCAVDNKGKRGIALATSTDDISKPNLKVTDVTCNLKNGLIVTDNQTVKLGWRMERTTSEEASQSAYQIQIFSHSTGRIIYDSKKKVSSQSQLIPQTLPYGHYRWHVRVWDNKGIPTQWSNEREIIVQDAEKAFGDAKWIGAITKADAHTPEGRTFSGAALKQSKPLWESADTLSRRSIYVSKTFTPKRYVHSAILNVCGLGFYELKVKGKLVSNAQFAPLWSDYDKSVFYNTYDLTPQIAGKKKPISIEALLGNGFYNEQGGRYRKLCISFGPPTLKAALHLVYDDGTSETLVTDETWEYAPSELTFNSIYGGEDYDARISKEWRPVVVQEGPKGILRPQEAPEVRIMDLFTSKTWWRSNSSLMLDMGQNLSGFPEITVIGKNGQIVTITDAEKLTDDSLCNQKQTGRPHLYKYTLRGDSIETYRPRFSYYGYRYLQIEGAVLQGEENPDSLPVITDVKSYFVHNSAPEVSTFECSNPLINRTHEIIVKATRSNMQSVFTDCPHREKLGWLEQDWLNGPGLFYNYDLSGFMSQTEQNICDAQHDDGAIPTTAPEYTYFRGPGLDVFAESPEWGGAFIMIPQMYKEFYGDDGMIGRYYPAMLRYVDYLHSLDSCGILRQGLGDWYDYGDFRSGFSRNTSVPLVSTAHHYRWTRMVADFAKSIGKTTDASALSLRAEMIRDAWQKEFYANGLVNSQTAIAIALDQHLVPEKDRPTLLSALVADIHSHGDRLTTGDIGTRYLFDVLTSGEIENGTELLYTMLNHNEVPGYGFQIKKGMTTLSEQWNPDNGSSLNHFMLGHIDQYHFSTLAGIRIDGKNVYISPKKIGDIKWVKASTQAPYGTIKVDYNFEREIPEIKFEIPVGMNAIINEK